ncbi:MAG: uroporphyrinogen-III synthase, partial [Candidatus Fimenecus sp.]
LAALHGTLVFLMGLHNLETICKKLMENGKSKDTPAAVLSKGFDRQQQRIDGTLETIAQKAASAQTPAVLAVGDTVAFDFRKTVKLPLETVSVTVTGTKAFTARLSAKLTALGAFVTETPLLQIVAQPDRLPETFDAYTYLVFTSANGVNVFFDCLQGRKTDYRTISHLKFACIGDACAASLEKYGFYADFVPREFTAAALGKELPAVLNKKDSLLLVRAKNGAEELPAALQTAKIKFEDINIYDTQVTACPTDCDTDYITFASASGVAAFFENGGQFHGAKPVCIGESTARELKKHSDVIPLVAKIHTAEGIISAISEDIQ